MDKSIQYVQVMSNFNSVYNAPLNLIPQPTTYIPMSSSATFGSLSNRSSSPLFRRSKSPPPQQPILTESGPKFNFDLYKMDENNNQYDGYSSPSYRSLSPSSSRIIYHHPTHSPLSSSDSKTQALSKLRQINDELCQTLARSELIDPSQQLPRHYHIHHYPLSQHPYENYRPESTREDYSPSKELEVSPNLHKARVKYKIHIPQQQLQQHRKSSRHKSISDVSSSDDTITIDLYPTRDQGFVKQVRKHPDNQSPWVVDGTSLRRDSYSDTKTSRTQHTPKGPYYGDKPIKPHRRSHRGKERPSSSSRHRSSRNRSNSAQLNTSDPYRESNASFSNTKPVWRPNGAHAPPPKPKSSSREASWKPTGIANKTKHIRAFQPTLKPEYDVPTTEKSIIIDATESEPIPQRKILPNRTKIRGGDPKLKKRIANAESKVKSAWEPTITGLSQSTTKEAKPPIPHLVQKQTTITTPPKIKSVPSEPATPIKKVVTAPPQPPTTNANTDRSSLNDIPTKPIFESTPRNQSIVGENDDSAEDLFGNESRTSERSKKQELPHLPPQVEKITTPPPEQPRKPSAELPKSTVPDKDTKPTIKHGNNNQPSSSASQADNKTDDEESSAADNVQPTPQPPEVPTSERKASTAKSDSKNDESVVDEEEEDEDEDDQEVARSFDINKWLNGASKAIFGASKKGDTTPPSPSQPPPTSNAKSSPRRKEPPPPESPDHNLYKPPFGPKNKDQKPATPPPPPTDETDDAEDFFS